MANYTISKFKATETKGDSVFFRNMVTYGTLIITPKQNYVVSASDFSLVSLPSNIKSVTFVDETTAGQPGNTILVTANLTDTFVLTGNTKILLNISGDAKLWKPEIANVDTSIILVDDKNENSYGSSTIEIVNGYNINTVTTIGETNESGVPGETPEGLKNAIHNTFTQIFSSTNDIVTSTITGSTTKNTPTKVGSITITANTGYYFRTKPYLKVLKTLSTLKLKQKSITKDSNKRVTSYTFDIIFRSSVNLSTNNENKVFIKYNASLIPTSVSTTEIKNIIYGDSQVSPLGEDRVIYIYGDTNAEFDLTITKDSDGTSILDSINANSEKFTPSGLIDSFKKKITSTGYCSFLQKFPKPIMLDTNLSSSMSDSTTMNIDSKEGLVVGDRIKMGGIAVGKTIKIATIDGTHNRVTTTEAITADDNAKVEFIREEKYYINIYPRTGTTLSSKIPTLEPHYTLNQYMNPLLKLTATNSSASSNPADIIYTGVPNANYNKLKRSNIKGAIGSTATRTDNPHYFKISYSLTASSGDWRHKDTSLPKWSSTVSADSSWTNSLHNSADTTPTYHGTHIEIFNIAVGGTGTSTATVTADVLVKKMGTKDVTMVIELDPVLDTT